MPAKSCTNSQCRMHDLRRYFRVTSQLSFQVYVLIFTEVNHMRNKCFSTSLMGTTRFYRSQWTLENKTCPNSHEGPLALVRRQSHFRVSHLNWWFLQVKSRATRWINSSWYEKSRIEKKGKKNQLLTAPNWSHFTHFSILLSFKSNMFFSVSALLCSRGHFF